MKYSLCLLAAGKGTRKKLPYNKVFYEVRDGDTVLDASLNLFLQDPDCQQILLMYARDDKEYMQERYGQRKEIELYEGGKTRQESAYIALKHVGCPYVFIHDAARPYLERENIELLKQTLETEDACLLMVPSVDTVKIVRDGYVHKTLLRTELYNAQTPQCFKTDLILSCYERSMQEKRQATDDAQLVEWYSDVPVKVVSGNLDNRKITLPKDLGL